MIKNLNIFRRQVNLKKKFKKYLGRVARLHQKSHMKMVLISLAIIVFLSYGLTLGMYIWQDDNAIMFKLQNLEEGGGNLGHGLYDRNTPYRGVIVPLVPLYYFFGLEPIGYFAAGLIVYFLASVTVYFLAKEISNNRDFAFGAAIIFAAGFIGGETLWRIYNSIHSILNIIFVCLSLIFYIRAVRRKNVIQYLISLFFFWIAIETGYVRAHGIVFLILGLELIFYLNFNLIKSIARIVPFVGLYYYYYGGNADSGPVNALITKIFSDGKIEILFAPFITLKNIIIPDIFYVPDWLFMAVLILLLIWKRSRILWFSVIFMMQSYLVPFIHNQGQIFASIHRYLTLSLVGLALFYSELFSNFFKQKKFFFVAILIVAGIHLYLIDKEQLRIVSHIGIPTRNFYRQLTEQLPDVPKDSAIYFDVAADAESQNQFYNFFGVGSMPEMTAIAIYYNIDRYDLTLPATFNELLSLLKNNKTTPDKIFTFYFDARDGLINTTGLARQGLFGQIPEVKINDLNAINLKYSSPLEFKFTADTKLEKIDIFPEKADKNFSKYLKYLLSRNDFYQRVTATASSEWKYQEIENLVDNNLDTSWMAHRGSWHYGRIENVTLDLGSPKEIGALRVNFRSKGKAATKYTYLCSEDNISWRDLKQVFRSVTHDSEEVIDKIPLSSCRFIKMVINNTVNEDEPQISELEAVELQYSDLDFVRMSQIAQNPFMFIGLKEDKTELENYLNLNGITAEVCKTADKRKNPDPLLDCQDVKLALNTKQEYSVIIPPDGTALEKIEIRLLPNVNLQVSNPTINFITFKDLLDRGYIFDYSQN